MPTSITEVEKQLQDLFGPQADQIAREKGMIKRQRQISGSSFVLGLVMEWMQEPSASLTQLAQSLGQTNTFISASGLNQRFTREAADVMRTVLERLIQMRLRVEPVEIAVLQRFSAVLIEDSTHISLPASLHSSWKGSGNASQPISSCVKLHVRWDLLHGELWGPCFTDGIIADQHSPLIQEHPLPEGSLSVLDSGYFNLQRMHAEQERGCFVLTRPRATTAFFDRDGTRLSLPQIGPRQVGEALDLEVLIGAQARVPARLIMIRVPHEVAQQRRQRVERTAQRHGRAIKPEYLHLVHWTILITTVPQHLLRTEEVVSLQRARWQIELLFRWWKDDGLLDESRSGNPWRVLCELYAKLIGLLLNHWLMLLTCWQDPRRSLVKAGRFIRTQVFHLFQVFSAQGSLHDLIQWLTGIIGRTCQVDRRRKKPSTAQLLLACSVSP